MKLLRLELNNFKGIKHFVLTPRGENITVLGDNATGKTSLCDSFLWLLFGKDSQNRQDFDIKTLDQDGNAIHGLEHTVEASLGLDDGQELTLKKVYREQWTKQRGSAERTFTGHTVDHFVDGVPVKKQEFTDKIAGIIDEDIFRLLTDPMYFNTQLHWKDRRRILLEVCGDISDADVIASDRALAKLPDILGQRSLEDHRKVITARRTEINRELDKIPVRIDEIELGLPDISQIKPEALADDMAKLQAEIKKKESELLRIEQGGQVAEKMHYLREIEGELLRLRNEARNKDLDELDKLKKDVNHYSDAAMNLQADIKRTERTIQDAGEEIADLETKLTHLRQDYRATLKKEFDFETHYEQEDACPTCGQDLPEEQIAEAREKAVQQFNAEKARQLEQNQADGKRLLAKKEELEGRITALRESVEDKEKLKKQEEKLREEVREKIREIERKDTPDPTATPEYEQLLDKKEQTQQEVDQLKTDTRAAISAAEEQLESLRQALRALEDAQVKVRRREEGMARVEELKSQEKALAKEYEKLEKELHLTEEFVRAKVRLLESKINSKFKLARFKLFQEQVNGGLAEVCEMQYKGVPFSSLNNGARINTGMDIINTLSDHYGVVAPIFVDNREAVTQLIDTRGQTISLVVSERDKTLRVETDGQQTLLDKKEAS